MRLIRGLCVLGLLGGCMPQKDQGSNTLEVTSDDSGSFDDADAAAIQALFKKIIDQRHPPGTTNVKRPVFLKPHGCARATFTVAGGLPEHLQVGLFKTASTHDAWVRTSSDTVPSTPDQGKSTVGFSVKVLGVEGAKVLEGEESAGTQDFLTQNHHVFFVDKARDFLEFTEAAFAGTLDAYFAAHPATDQILKDMDKDVENVLGQTYWSTLPSRFGRDNYAKYVIKPCTPLAAEPSPAPNQANKNYLKQRLSRDLADHEACFELAVQLRDGNEAFPLDAATVAWTSEPQTVATIKLLKQEISGNDATCENMAFTAWHSLEEHRPVGSVQKARGLIYKFFADLRRSRNDVPLGEPQ